MTLILTQTAFAAQQYTCTDKAGVVADLTVYNSKQVEWNEDYHSANSRGEFIGKDKAPYSPYKGYSLFKLYDFYFTDDSSYVLGLRISKNGNISKAVIYLDNDDHIEEENEYTCVIKK